jgi:hypothetical protein
MISAAIAKTPSKPSIKPFTNSKFACSTNSFEPTFSAAASRASTPGRCPFTSTCARGSRDRKSIRRVYEIENRERGSDNRSCAPMGWLQGSSRRSSPDGLPAPSSTNRSGHHFVAGRPGAPEPRLARFRWPSRRDPQGHRRSHCPASNLHAVPMHPSRSSRWQRPGFTRDAAFFPATLLMQNPPASPRVCFFRRSLSRITKGSSR